jgi:hypothetical protein
MDHGLLMCRPLGMHRSALGVKGNDSMQHIRTAICTVSTRKPVPGEALSEKGNHHYTIVPALLGIEPTMIDKSSNIITSSLGKSM